MSAITAKQNIIIAKLDRLIELLEPKVAYDSPIDSKISTDTLPVQAEVNDHVESIPTDSSVSVPMTNAGGDDSGRSVRMAGRGPGRPRKSR